MKPCHTCGVLLAPALADAVNGPGAEQTCPKAAVPARGGYLPAGARFEIPLESGYIPPTDFRPTPLATLMLLASFAKAGD